MKICHFSSAHEIDDIRVFVKECKTLSEAGNEVYLVACGYKGKKKVDGVKIIGIGDPPSNRLKRMLFFSKKAFRTAVATNCDIYHFHDPELLRYGVRLKRLGKIVVFDSHEDVPAQIMDKYWIPKPARKIVSTLYKNYESSVVKKIDAVVTATPYIRNQFASRAKKVIDINNFPRLDDIELSTEDFAKRKSIACYAGGINDLRGESVMVEAMKGVKGTLIIAGDHEAIELDRVKYVGRLDRKGVNELYAKSVVGLCVLQPIANYVNSQPIKMYEYMAAGIPFICSDFPKWKALIEESHAGICIDPLNSDMLSDAINDLLDNREKAQLMGRNGYAYVKKHCSWEHEGEKLVRFYENLCPN